MHTPDVNGNDLKHKDTIKPTKNFYRVLVINKHFALAINSRHEKFY